MNYIGKRNIGIAIRCFDVSFFYSITKMFSTYQALTSSSYKFSCMLILQLKNAINQKYTSKEFIELRMTGKLSVLRILRVFRSLD